MSHQASASTWRRNGIRVSALAVGGESCVATWGLADCIKEDIYSLANKRRICYAFRVVLRTWFGFAARPRGLAARRQCDGQAGARSQSGQGGVTMPDAEQIVLEIDERPAVAAVDRANKAIGSHEQSVKTFMDNAGRKWESYGDTVVRVNDKSRSSLDRLIKSMEQQAAVAGKTGVEKLVAERDILIRKWGDEEKAVQAITKAYAAKIEAEKASSSSMQAFGQNAQMFLQNPMQGAQSAITGAAQAMGPFGIATVGTVTALVAVGTAAYGAMKSLGEYGTEIRNTALRTGLSTQEVQAYGFAAKMVGQDVSIFERSMRGLTMAVEDNSAKGQLARGWLEKFGVDIRALKDGSAGTAETFEKIATGLSGLSTQWERNKALQIGRAHV